MNELTLKQLELLILLYNKSMLNIKSYEPAQIDELVQNNYLYRKQGQLNLTVKAREFVETRVKTKDTVEEILAKYDLDFRRSLFRVLGHNLKMEHELDRMIAKNVKLSKERSSQK